MPKKQTVTVPPELNGFVAQEVISGLEQHQRDAIIRLVGSGLLSPEEAGTCMGCANAARMGYDMYHHDNHRYRLHRSHHHTSGCTRRSTIPDAAPAVLA